MLKNNDVTKMRNRDQKQNELTMRANNFRISLR